ncbi:ATP-binding cassette domain-containing protein [Pedobacter sp. Leaf194]|uniref:ATP-binding cassette domain-containing protein n=1 Tax=Pedobacter sp. Leaf194 TaxID=1736297 RepID=UPI00070391B8|nr:ATP-binding cassette domain-containing protein [Pedobacter sp. Leaf194]KQS36991.1 molybdenum ABC transporter ATP-binding protein [Pedobacter sp. Leaf194]
MININIEKQIGGRYGGFRLKVDTAFRLNTITQISGPSGIGKTTLLKIIAGLTTPDNGTLSVDEEVWFDKEKQFSKRVQEREVGFVFQDYALFSNMTVEQHLKFGTNDASYMSSLLELGEMNQFRKRYPKQLSGGQQQRLAILRALSTKPRFLLLDEPFTALDSELKLRITTRLKSLFEEQKTTVILVSHLPNEFGKGDCHVFALSGS